MPISHKIYVLKLLPGLNYRDEETFSISCWNEIFNEVFMHKYISWFFFTLSYSPLHCKEFCIPSHPYHNIMYKCALIMIKQKTFHHLHMRMFFIASEGFFNSHLYPKAEYLALHNNKTKCSCNFGFVYQGKVLHIFPPHNNLHLFNNWKV